MAEAPTAKPQAPEKRKLQPPKPPSWPEPIGRRDRPCLPPKQFGHAFEIWLLEFLWSWEVGAWSFDSTRDCPRTTANLNPTVPLQITKNVRPDDHCFSITTSRREWQRWWRPPPELHPPPPPAKVRLGPKSRRTAPLFPAIKPAAQSPARWDRPAAF